MIDPGGDSALAQASNPVHRLDLAGTDRPDDVRQERPLILDHELLIGVAIEPGPAEPMQGIEVVIQNSHLVLTAVFDGEHASHEIDEVVKARAEVECGPVEEARAALCRKVDIAKMRIAVQKSAEPRVALCIVPIQCRVHPLAVH